MNVDWLSDTRELLTFLGVIMFFREHFVFRRYMLKYLRVKYHDVCNLLSITEKSPQIKTNTVKC